MLSPFIYIVDDVDFHRKAQWNYILCSYIKRVRRKPIIASKCEYFPAADNVVVVLKIFTWLLFSFCFFASSICACLYNTMYTMYKIFYFAPCHLRFLFLPLLAWSNCNFSDLHIVSTLWRALIYCKLMLFHRELYIFLYRYCCCCCFCCSYCYILLSLLVYNFLCIVHSTSHHLIIRRYSALLLSKVYCSATTHKHRIRSNNVVTICIYILCLVHE